MIQSIDFSKIVFKPATVTFLEMHEKPTAALQPIPGTEFILQEKPIDVNDYRSYYYGVGEKHNWLDRMVMADEELSEKINADNIEIYLFKVNNETAGYIEFIKESRFTEILYFGIMPAFIGKGLGKYFLQWVIEKAWELNSQPVDVETRHALSLHKPEWIQLNTCTLDHPNALPNYKKAGFKEVRTEIQQRRVLS
jgi:GNAT superfamily N-acetyltransferase